MRHGFDLEDAPERNQRGQLVRDNATGPQNELEARRRGVVNTLLAGAGSQSVHVIQTERVDNTPSQSWEKVCL
jgi:hypothetical protein